MQRSHASVAAVAFAALASLSCRKAPPAENVYTGGVAVGPGMGVAPVRPPPVVPVDVLPGDETFSKVALLSGVADCALNRYRMFAGTARTLRDAARANASSPAGLLDETKAGAVRDAWRATMSVFQETELFRFGPAAPSMQPGGRDLRDQMHPWPLVGRCTIDEQLTTRAYERTDFSASVATGRGLGALEYLTFYKGLDNGCSASLHPMNTAGTWAAVSPSDLAARKVTYAARVADELASRAEALVGAWEPSSGNFRREVVTAGSGSATFPREHDALNAISDALFYLDKEVKDWKLGRPAGLVDCFGTAGTCPELFESRYAEESAANIRSNLRGFRMVFQGCGDNGAGVGFDDWLVAVGARSLAGRMLGALGAADQALAGLDGPIEDVLAADSGQVVNVYAVMKALTDLLKTEFVTVLNLELPKMSEGDND